MAKRNPELPGMEKPSIPEIEEAADSYVSVRDKRMALTEKEITAKINLIAVVTDNAAKLEADEDGNKCYRFDDLIVILKPGKPGVKVKSAHDGEEEEDDE